MKDIFLPTKLIDPQNNTELDILLRDERSLNGQNKREWLSYLSERLLLNSDEGLLNRALDRLSEEGFINRGEMESYSSKYELPIEGRELVSVKSIMFALTIKYRKLYLHFSKSIKVSEVPYLNISIKKKKVYCNLSKIYNVFTGIYFQDLLKHIDSLEEREAVLTINKFVREFNSYNDRYLKPFIKRLEILRASIESDITLNATNTIIKNTKIESKVILKPKKRPEDCKWFQVGVVVATGEFDNLISKNPSIETKRIVEILNLEGRERYIRATKGGIDIVPKGQSNSDKNIWNKTREDFLAVIKFCKSEKRPITQKFLDFYKDMNKIES